MIKEYQYIQSLFTSKFIDSDKIDIPQDWFDSKKKTKVQKMTAKGTNVRRKKLTGELTGKVALPLERGVSGKNCKFTSEVFQMKDAHKDKKLTIYTHGDNDAKIDKLFTIVKRDKIRLILLSDREMKNMSKIELFNWMNMEQFEKGENKAFKRIVTSYLIYQLSLKYPSVFDKYSIIDTISSDLGSKIATLDKYKDTWYRGGREDLYKAMLEVAESKNLFDPAIYSTYKEIKKVLERLPFLNHMIGNTTTYGDNSGMLNATKDLFKYYRQKMNWENYKIV